MQTLRTDELVRLVGEGSMELAKDAARAAVALAAVRRYQRGTMREGVAADGEVLP